MKPILTMALLMGAFLLASGCGGPAVEPPVTEIPGYEALREQFVGLDLLPLQNRRIVLDPGHGGYFKGAVGQAGLTEADVNLGVALYLRGLLEWAGSEVFMTRTADTDFLSPSDSTLVGDLAFRVSLTDSLQPDVFLSLHHNSVASLDRTVNETQTYYPLGDDGASLDLAQAIHRHLVLNLEITPARILPGNFHVLRGATVPAVLGEPAMISHPIMEGRLSLAASQRLEAEAYFLGLLDYFSQGAPRWAGAPLDTVLVTGKEPSLEVSWTFQPDVSGPNGQPKAGPGPDPGTFELTLDGQPVFFHVTDGGRRVHWDLADPDLDLPAVLELRGRNLTGRATPVRRTVLWPGGHGAIQLMLFPESEPDGNEWYLAAHWQVKNTRPLPAGRFRIPGQEDWPIEGGTSGSALLRFTDPVPEQVTFHPEDPALPSLVCELQTSRLPVPWRWRLLAAGGESPPRAWALRRGNLLGVPTGLVAQDIPLIPHDPGRPVFLTSAGLLPMVDPDPELPGAPRTVSANDRTWVTEPLVPGLRDRVIVLDPAGGGSVTDGVGPLGIRGATLNLETALLAKGLLEGCGAKVHLTRQGEIMPPQVDKVRMAGAVNADLFLTIGRSGSPDQWIASHHPGSEMGRLWAGLWLKSVSQLTAPGDSLAVRSSYNYLLRHTSCPALEVRLPGAETPSQEMRLAHRGWQRAEARAVLLSIVSLFSGHEELAPTLKVADVIAGLPGVPPPARIDWAELDGNFIWSPIPGPAGETTADSLDSFHDPGLPALLDRHTLEIHAGSLGQLWLLERSGAGFSARLMMRNP